MCLAFPRGFSPKVARGQTKNPYVRCTSEAYMYVHVRRYMYRRFASTLLRPLRPGCSSFQLWSRNSYDVLQCTVKNNEDLRWRARQKFFSQRRHGKSDRKCRDSPPMSLENKHEAQIRVLKMLILSEI